MSVRFVASFSLAMLVFLIACKKEKSPNPPSPPPPPVPEKKYILTAIKDSAEGHEYFTWFEYGANKRPSICKTKKDGIVQADSTLFFYNSKTQLIRSIDYGSVLGTIPREIRLYYYNSAGQLVGDTAFDANMTKTNFWDYGYSYDAQGRLVKAESWNAYYKRYEYASGGNPVKSYEKPYNKPAEALLGEYTQYDNKKPVTGIDSVMRIILTHRGSSYTDNYPVFGFGNNATTYFWNPYPPAGINLRREITQQFEYNEAGYPRRVVITTSKQFEAGNAETRVLHFEYAEVN